MLYTNQFVQTGAKSDIGEKLTTNISRSYRMGTEISAGWNPTQTLTIEGNAALSVNKLKDFDEVVETYDADWHDMPATTLHYDKSTLAFSPSAILNGFIDFHTHKFKAVWHTAFVSRQYIDNTQNRDRSLPAYSTSSLNLSYEFRNMLTGFNTTTVGLHWNNIFNQRYASSAWVYSAIVGDDYPANDRYYQIGYIPTSGSTIMGSVTIRF